MGQIYLKIKIKKLSEDKTYLQFIKMLSIKLNFRIVKTVKIYWPHF